MNYLVTSSAQTVRIFHPYYTLLIHSLHFDCVAPNGLCADVPLTL